MNRKLKRTRKFIYLAALVFIVLFSVGYSALSSSSNISGSMHYNVKKPVRVTGISLSSVANSGTEQFSPSYTWNTTTTGVNLPNLSSTVTYAVTIRNYGSDAKGLKLDITSNSNSSMTYTVSNMPSGNTIAGNSTVTINITVKYGVSTLPATKTDTMTITYSFLIPGAMFNTGTSVNAKMKKFVNSSATYNTQDTTITKIQRYTGTPSSTYLVDANIVSSSEYYCPIYMWYDSSTTTIYWYTIATSVYFNPNSGYFFSNLRALNSIANLNDISTTYTTSMAYMFNYAGYSSTSFTLSLGSNFNTANVTDMNNMFAYAGKNSTAYTLSLGSNFDTTNVTNMSNLFRENGYSNTSFTLSLGSKFKTSNVTNMNSMFYGTGHNSTTFTLSLGSYFNTAKVTNMASMFRETGYSSTSFTLNLGSNFNTVAATSMSYMFYKCGYTNPSFTLTLGSNFDTGIVTDMSYMFGYVGYSSTSFTLNLGSKFNTVSATNMSYMFDHTGYSSTSFTLNLGSSFDTSNVTTMAYMFQYAGYTNTSFTLTLGSKFNTAKVTKMLHMFDSCGYNSTTFTLSLGSLFDTGLVTDMDSMFKNTGRSNTSFTLSLGSKFNTASCTDMRNMFQNTGFNSTSFTLSLGSLFDTSKVAYMQSMFDSTGYNSTSFTLSLGSKFDTSKVTTMSYMFQNCGYSSTVFTLSLGSKFDTSNVTNMSYMFRYLGYSNSSFTTLDLGDKFDTSKVTSMSYMFNSCRYLTTIYAPSTFVTTAVTSSSGMFTSDANLVGGAGTVYSSSNVTATYAHIDSTSNPGYFTARGSKIATIYYNSNTTSGSLTVSKAITSCVPSSGSSCTITVPSVVSSSVGKYNSAYKGVSTSLSSMASSSLTISSNTTFYANYSKQVTNYYYGSSYTNRTLYRNEFFTSTSAMESRLSTANTSTANYSTAVGPGSSVWTGLSTGADTTTEYSSVQNAANSNSATLYTVYTLNITYAKGSNVSSIGATSGISGGVTLTFNANGGSVTPSSKTVVPGNTYNDLPTPTKSGNDFTGWYANFTGSNYINYGRSYMWTDKISVHFRAYRDDWSGNYAIISSTEDGGWEVYVTAGKPEGWMYDSGTGYKTIKSSTALTSGWHTFDLIFDGSKEYLWVDGTNVATSAAFSSGKIGYNSGNSLILGAEAGSGSTPTGEY